MIKKKSLIVAMVSSTIICGVLVLTLVGYLAYLELKHKEFVGKYNEMMAKVSAKLYSRHLEISLLEAVLEDAGPLKGKPILRGSIKNRGYRAVSDLIIRVSFKDPDGAVLYEVVFHPQHPTLGSSGLTQVPIPYISNAEKAPIEAGGSVNFKKIMTNCPREIMSELVEPEDRAKSGQRRWRGKLEAETLAVVFR
jgi:hypothetical protein